MNLGYQKTLIITETLMIGVTSVYLILHFTLQPQN